jgi:hypothetical protein
MCSSIYGQINVHYQCLLAMLFLAYYQGNQTKNDYGPCLLIPYQRPCRNAEKCVCVCVCKTRQSDKKVCVCVCVCVCKTRQSDKKVCVCIKKNKKTRLPTHEYIQCRHEMWAGLRGLTSLSFFSYCISNLLEQIFHSLNKQRITMLA